MTNEDIIDQIKEEIAVLADKVEESIKKGTFNQEMKDQVRQINKRLDQSKGDNHKGKFGDFIKKWLGEDGYSEEKIKEILKELNFEE